MPKNIYGAYVLIGGGTGALDAIDGADLADSDMAIVVTLIATYRYSLDVDSAATEASPDVIEPDANGGNKRWILASVDSKTTARRLDNFFPNAAFASRSGGTSAKPDGYTLEGTPTVAYDIVDPGYGDHAVKFTATGAADEGMNVTLTHLKVSTKYQVFARVKVTGGDTASLTTTGATTNIDEDSTSATWEDIEGEFITDASGTDVVVKFVAESDNDVAYFCGITCVEGDIPPGNFIRRVNETIYLPVALTSTSWDGDAHSTSQADIDLSAFGNGCPPKIKAVLVAIAAADSDSAANNALFGLNPGGIVMTGATNSALFNSLYGTPSNVAKGATGWVVCDANGDIRYIITATGEGTLDAYIRIYGYVLGE